MSSIEDIFKGIFADTGSLDAVKDLFGTISGSVSSIFNS